MPPPFPGMDPYLERPGLWPDVHNSLIAALRDTLAPILRPRYYVAIEERTYLTQPEELAFIGRPDAAVVGRRTPGPEAPMADTGSGVLAVEVPVPDQVRETYLEVREAPGGDVVTAIEILSPTNKRPGEGRRLYEEKRLILLGTRTHLVEIDLLRAGAPMPLRGNGHAANYRILVSRSHRRPRADLYVFGVRQPIPTFPLPLRPGEEEPLLDLNVLLHGLYDRAGYDLRVNYTRESEPPLNELDSAWAGVLLCEHGLRS